MSPAGEGSEGAESQEAPAQDPVGLVLTALAFGTSLGVGLQGVVTFTVRAIQQGTPATGKPTLDSAPALVLLIGTLTGIVGAGLASWTLLAPIRNPWRQAMLAIVAGLSSFVISLVSIPLDGAFGRAGLLALVALAVLSCVLIGRRLATGRGASGGTG